MAGTQRPTVRRSTRRSRRSSGGTPEPPPAPAPRRRSRRSSGGSTAATPEPKPAPAPRRSTRNRQQTRLFQPDTEPTFHRSASRRSVPVSVPAPAPAPVSSSRGRAGVPAPPSAPRRPWQRRAIQRPVLGGRNVARLTARSAVFIDLATDDSATDADSESSSSEEDSDDDPASHSGFINQLLANALMHRQPILTTPGSSFRLSVSAAAGARYRTGNHPSALPAPMSAPVSSARPRPKKAKAPRSSSKPAAKKASRTVKSPKKGVSKKYVPVNIADFSGFVQDPERDRRSFINLVRKAFKDKTIISCSFSKNRKALKELHVSSEEPPRKKARHTRKDLLPPPLDMDDDISYLLQTVDLKGLRAIFASIKKVKASFNALKTVTGNVCRSLRSAISSRATHDSLSYGAEARLLVILLELPFLADLDAYETHLMRIIVAIGSLPLHIRKLLWEFFSHYDQEHFRRLLVLFQSYVTTTLYRLMQVTKEVMLAVKCVALMNKANELAHERCISDDKSPTRWFGKESERLCAGLIVPRSEFHNDAVNRVVQMAAEYDRWTDPKNVGSETRLEDLSFLNFPFLLDPASKRRVMNAEAERRQRSHGNMSVLSMRMLFFGHQQPYFILRVHRSRIVADTLQQLEERSDELLRPIKVIFIGEEGVDEGGVKKEFFQLLVRELFSPKYAMFGHNKETNSYWFSRNWDMLEEPQRFYKLIGTVLGLAIYNGVLLEVAFPKAIFALLLNQEVEFSHLIDADPDLAKGLISLLEYKGNVKDDICRSFQLEYVTPFGETKTVDLKKNGKNIPVTRANRNEFVRLYTKWSLHDSVAREIAAFRSGFHRMCGGYFLHARKKALQLFDGDELEMLVCGTRELNFTDLRRVTRYEGYKKDDPYIEDFWDIVNGMTPEQQQKFLFFSTGCSRAPIKGLSDLFFVVSQNGHDTDRLPTSSTCFNHLLLPEYRSKQKLKEKLLIAISHSQGFGLK